MGRAEGKARFVEGKMGDRGRRFLHSANMVQRRALRQSAVGQGGAKWHGPADATGRAGDQADAVQ
jgi:hypothetical protein